MNCWRWQMWRCQNVIKMKYPREKKPARRENTHITTLAEADITTLYICIWKCFWIKIFSFRNKNVQLLHAFFLWLRYADAISYIYKSVFIRKRRMLSYRTSWDNQVDLFTFERIEINMEYVIKQMFCTETFSEIDPLKPLFHVFSP